MSYRRFLASRGRLWDAFEERLGVARSRPRELGYEALSQLTVEYRQVLHDHALAAARYPGTSAARRLERLALEGTHWLHRDTGDRLPTVVGFFARSFPRAMARVAPRIGLVAALFFLAAAFGLALTAVEPALGVTFVGPEALAGLREGTLWTESIFSTVPGAVASGFIATNNLTVLLTAWAGGALAGLGALYAALLNGLMLGSVVGLTAQWGLEAKLFSFIAAHGPLEISLILVAAGAGLEMGWALVRAGDEPRGRALRSAARDALVVLLGSMPWILVLGFVEGFVSPLALPTTTKLGLGLLLEGLFLLTAWGPWWRSALVVKSPA